MTMELGLDTIVLRVSQLVDKQTGNHLREKVLLEVRWCLELLPLPLSMLSLSRLVQSHARGISKKGNRDRFPHCARCDAMSRPVGGIAVPLPSLGHFASKRTGGLPAVYLPIYPIGYLTCSTLTRFPSGIGIPSIDLCPLHNGQATGQNTRLRFSCLFPMGNEAVRRTGSNAYRTLSDRVSQHRKCERQARVSRWAATLLCGAFAAHIHIFVRCLLGLTCAFFCYAGRLVILGWRYYIQPDASDRQKALGFFRAIFLTGKLAFLLPLRYVIRTGTTALCLSVRHGLMVLAFRPDMAEG